MDHPSQYDTTVISTEVLQTIPVFPKTIEIESVLTVFYREFTSTYVYKGESHNFWEFLYVDKGDMFVSAGDKVHHLNTDEIIFHKPNEFHAITTNGVIAPNAIVVSFLTSSPLMRFFEDKIVMINESSKSLLGKFLKEARSYCPALGQLWSLSKEYEEPVIGSRQMMINTLEIFLINLYRLACSMSVVTESGKINIKNSIRGTVASEETELVRLAIQFLQQNVYSKIRLEDIYKNFYVSPTQLKTAFKRDTGMGLITFLNRLKVEEAKKLIRERKYNFTEIGTMLGYESVHYFSTSFKKWSGMTPTEYESSVKSIAEE